MWLFSPSMAAIVGTRSLAPILDLWELPPLRPLLSRGVLPSARPSGKVLPPLKPSVTLAVAAVGSPRPEGPRAKPLGTHLLSGLSASPSGVREASAGLRHVGGHYPDRGRPVLVGCLPFCCFQICVFPRVLDLRYRKVCVLVCVGEAVVECWHVDRET